jgi:hypothetical protein
MKSGKRSVLLDDLPIQCNGLSCAAQYNCALAPRNLAGPADLGNPPVPRQLSAGGACRSAPTYHVGNWTLLFLLSPLQCN